MLIKRRLPRDKRNLLTIQAMRVTTAEKDGDYVLLDSVSQRNAFMESVRNSGYVPKTQKQPDGKYKLWILEP